MGVRQVASYAVPAALFASLVHVLPWSDALLEGGVPWARYLALAGQLAFSVVYAGLVIVVAWNDPEWIRRVLTVPPIALGIGLALGSGTLAAVWDRPAYQTQGYLTTSALPIIVVAPLSIMIAGTIRAMRDARRGRDVRTDTRPSP
jgi:hypothetical protein